MIVYETMMAIRHFDLFFILTEGGPGDASHVVAWRIYVETFRNLSFGTGAAMSYILALATLALAYVVIRPWRGGSDVAAGVAAAPSSSIDSQRYRAQARRARVGRAILLGVSSLLLLAYILAPMAWLVSSSFQSEREIVSKPPHWIPHEPTLANFRAIFTRQGENRHLRDPPRHRSGERRLHPVDGQAICCRRSATA